MGKKEEGALSTNPSFWERLVAFITALIQWVQRLLARLFGGGSGSGAGATA